MSANVTVSKPTRFFMSSAYPILLLGNPRLYEASTEVRREESDVLKPIVEALHDALMQFRSTYWSI